MLRKNKISVGNENGINRRGYGGADRSPELSEKIWHRVLLRRIGIDNLRHIGPVQI